MANEGTTGKGSPTPEETAAAAAAATQKTADDAAAATAAAKKTEDDAAAAAAAAASGGKKDDKATGDNGGTPKAPEKYDLVVPDGAAEWLGANEVKQIETLARANGMTNEQAQAALEAHADRLVEQSAAFRAETEAHPVYGGAKLEETQRLAGSVLDRFAPKGDPLNDAFRRELVASGFGNKLTVVSFLARIGKAMAEDKPSGFTGGGSTKKTAAQTLYGDDADK